MAYETPEDEWRAILTGQHQGMLKLRATFRGLPSSPRCKLCYAPFKGVGGLVLRTLVRPVGDETRNCARTA